jgi:signal transduction histidine kinase
MSVTAVTPYPEGMRLPAGLPRVLARIEAVSEDHGIAYPWWIPIVSVLAQLSTALIALGQRDQLFSLYLPAVLVLMAVPAGIQFATGHWMPWWLESGLMITAVALILSLPPHGLGAADFAPPALAFIAAEMTARDGWRKGLVVTAASAGLIFVASSTGHLQAAGIHALVLMVGAEIGYMFHWQARALAAEREARAVEHHRATLAERDRIAREIHDLVAHSLSVTMLHVTGARRLLADSNGSSGDDVGEAIEALRDAEQVGRQAMSDIRNTVGELATDGDPHRPLPTADDLPELVERVRDAGLRASYEARGDVRRLTPALGLGLFRVVQESLTNVTKHAPESPAHVSLAVGRSDARLTVRSTRTVPHAQTDGSGSGITGMVARIAQLGGTLTAQPDGDSWVVEATVPLGGDADASHCVVTRSINGLTEPKLGGQTA